MVADLQGTRKYPARMQTMETAINKFRIPIERIPEKKETGPRKGPGTPPYREWVGRELNQAIANGEKIQYLPSIVNADVNVWDQKQVDWLDKHTLTMPDGQVKTDKDGNPLTLLKVNGNSKAQKVALIKHICHTLINQMYEEGKIGLVYTATLPGKYHNLSRRKIPWTPYELYEILNRSFRNCYQNLWRMGDPPHYITSVEPHEDGTPHMHGVIFVERKNADRAIGYIQNMTDWNEPYPERQVKVEAIQSAGGCVAYTMKHINYLRKENDERTEAHKTYCRANGIRRFRLGGIFRSTAHQELRRLGMDPTMVEPIIPEFDISPDGEWKEYKDEGQLIMDDWKEQKKREEIEEVVKELAKSSHSTSYWDYWQLARKYNVRPVKDQPHCLKFTIRDEQTVIAILPGRWSIVYWMPHGYRPKITCSISLRQLMLESQGTRAVPAIHGDSSRLSPVPATG